MPRAAQSGPCQPARPVERLHIVINPVAARRHHSRLEKTLALLRRRGPEIIELVTRGPDDCRRLVERALREGASRIVVAGGDGTFREVAEAMIDADPAGACRLGLIPAGTANVVAQEVGLPSDPEGIVPILLSDHHVALRPGLANGRLFVFSCGIGFDAEAVAAVNPRLKALIGPGAYLASALGRMLQRPPDRFRVTIGETVYSAESVVIAKGRHYAGGHVLAAKADLRGDVFQVCLFRFATRFHMALFGAALIAGGAERIGNATTRAATEIRLEGDNAGPVQLDGDIVTRLPCHVTLAPRKVPLLVPAAYRDHQPRSP